MFIARREKLLEQMGAGVLLLPGNKTVLRNHDTEYDWRQDSDFYYLTGFDEPEAALLLTNQHPEHRSVLFLRPRDPAREQWIGSRLGPERAVGTLGVDAAFPIAELETRLPEYLKNVKRLHYRLGRNRAQDDVVLGAIGGLRGRIREGIAAPSEIVDTGATIHELRLRKSPEDITIMRRAAAVTTRAHLRAMAFARPGRFEYEVEAELLAAFRSGASPRLAYGNIVGSGPNATVLHYVANDRKMQDGDLLLIDAGCEFDYYASDITRTFPINGKFTDPQRRLYELVLSAQLAAIETVRPGATIDTVHDAALRVLAKGMIDLGLVDGSVDQLLEQKLYKPYYMHRTSHWLGMDVHDVGAYYIDGKARPFEPGFVLTVEPGIYVNPDAAVDPKWRGIGIRIEDDLVVTDVGHAILTKDMPKAPAELERLLSARS